MNQSAARIILICMTLLSGVVAYFVFIGPFLNDIESNLDEVAGVKSATEKLTEKSLTKKSKEELKEFLRRYEKTLVEGSHPANAVNFLRNVSQLHNVEKEILNIQLDESQKEQWPYFAIELSFSGKESNVFHFFSDLETADILIDIKEVNIRKKEDSRQKLTGNISLNIFSK